MAMPIRDIPVLKGKAAEDFLRRANEAYQKRGTIDMSAHAKDYKAIMKKAKL